MFRSHKKEGLALSLTVLTCLSSQAAQHSPANKKPKPSRPASSHRADANAPLRFEPNQGQHQKAVQFLARGSGYAVALADNKAVFSFNTGRGKRTPHARLSRPKETVFAMQFANARKGVVAQGEETLPGVLNYCKGEDRSKWTLGVSPVRKVRYKSLYNGVDALFYGNPRQLEYDFVVAPKADPKSIQLRFSGLQSLRLNKQGDLELRVGGKTAHWRKPVAYQSLASGRKEVAANYALASNGSVGFRLGSYDRTAPLVIDPVFTYSSFLGGNGEESGRGIAADGNGASYVVGYTNSPTMTAQDPAKIKNPYVGEYDAFVTKTDVNGNHVYTSYWGGAGDELANGIAIDGASPPSVFITGSTTSGNVTANPAFAGSFFYQAFVAKLDPTGLPALSWRFGGSDGDEGLDIAYRRVNSTTENLCIVGATSSGNFPIKLAGQPVSMGSGEGFLSCFDITGGNTVTHTHSTYIGNAGDDVASCVALSSNQIVVGGYTSSTRFYATRNAAQRTPQGGYDGFVMRFTKSASLVKANSSTLLGGEYDDYVYDLAVDNNSVAYAVGKTYSDTFPLSADAFQPFHNGWADAFLTGLNPDSSLVYSTLIGGEEDDSAQGIALVSSPTVTVPPTPPTVFLTGYTYAGFDLFYTFPTFAAEQTWAGEYDAFLTIFSPDRSLQESTLLGGYLDDVGLGVAVHANRPGEWWVTGTTYSFDFPTTETALSGAFSQEGATEAFVARFVKAPRLVSATLVPASGRVVVGAPASVTVVLDSLPPKLMDIRYQITDSDGNTLRDINYTAKTDVVTTVVPLNLPPVQQTTNLTVAVSFLSDRVELPLRLVAPRIKDITGVPKAVFSGQSITATVILDRLVQVDTTVLLSFDKAGARAPASVVVRKGTDRVTALITTRSSVDINPLFKAKLGSSERIEEIRILTPRTVTLSLNKLSIKGGAVDATGEATLTVAISPAAPAWATGLQVTFAAFVEAGGSVVTFTPTPVTIAPGGTSTTTKVTATTTTATVIADLEASLYGKLGSITISILK